MRGVISFLVASVFLLVLVSSAAKLSQRAPDVSYQPLVAMHVQEEAVRTAFSGALSDAAGKAQSAAQASGAGAEAPGLVKAAVYLAAQDFEAQLRAHGYDAIFWCGAPSGEELQEASARMASEGSAVLPDGAQPLSNPACAASFDVNLLREKVLVQHAGFSFYSQGAGIGHAVMLPDGFEVDIDGYSKPAE